MDGVVTKPVSLSALVNCIGAVLAKRRVNV
jgi:hypothetical protein